MAIVVIAADHDCTVAEETPDTVRNNELLVLKKNQPGTVLERIYCKWSTVASEIPAGAEIQRVRLGLHGNITDQEGSFPITVGVEKNEDADIDETTLTWNNQPNVHPGAGFFTFTFEQAAFTQSFWEWYEPGDSYFIDAVQAWLDGGGDNFGFLIALNSEAGGVAQEINYDDDSEGFAPRLEIEYYTAEAIPGSDPGDDRDILSTAANDRLDAQYDLKPAHQVIWTVDSVEQDITDDVLDLGEFRTVLPMIFEDFDSGEAVIVLRNGGRKFSPRIRDSILFEQQITETEIEIKSGLKINGVDELITQFVGVVDFMERDSGDAKGEIKMRSRLHKIFDQTITAVSYAAEDPVDAMYDLIINVLGHLTSHASTKAIFDAKVALAGLLTITRTVANETALSVLSEFARAARCTVYPDKEGRIAFYFWDDLTATGNEVAFTPETNIKGLRISEREDLILNRIVFNYTSDLSQEYIGTDKDSINRFGVREKTEDVNIKCIGTLQDIAALSDHVLSLRCAPPLELDIETTIEALRVDIGQQIIVTEPCEGLDEEVFVVIERDFSPADSEGIIHCIAFQ